MKTSKKAEDIFKPIKRSARSSVLLAEELSRIIVEGKVKPGDYLPSERDLAEKFQVTRNVVREALRSLEERRLLSVRHGSRITVLDYPTTAGLDFVVELLTSSEIGAFRLMHDIAEARRVLGRAMMFFAIDNLREECIPDIFEAVDIFCTESGKSDPDMGVLQDCDFEIQNRLMRSTNNQVMVLLHNSIRRIHAHVATLFRPLVAQHERLAANYRRMAECLKEGKREEAKDVFDVIFEEGTAALSQLDEGATPAPAKPKRRRKAGAGKNHKVR